MKDLKFSYTDKNGKTIQKDYDTIMDFTDSVVDGMLDEEFDKPTNGEATFFENPLNTKKFNTLSELYTHCKQIMK